MAKITTISLPDELHEKIKQSGFKISELVRLGWSVVETFEEIKDWRVERVYLLKAINELREYLKKADQVAESCQKAYSLLYRLLKEVLEKAEKS